ncbi:MAG: NADH:flavin oxidoreductase [SAR86 cluster bacterium]|jgi:2,4-dienoyl-CoA reductase-like NADH-dependent reductase (Old Yellow Enzyme family)|uniref:NADH:flavin oxidoreductase n=1 Tax=SAR86 cluster bacterium TaxID=2030880 RepID=A0A520N5Y0_9GAMM|nr:MAG: NADH:flavin oxidoreductase [SAR86 cluster bacterium]|tara:strand:- start:1996 stop:3075 length:1080 start_codon:yes stop_codon:yes gene_type:complete
MLFDEYKLKNLILRNRVVMAPMTRNQSPGGIPTSDVISYYARRAKAEVGLIITEGIEVSHIASSAYPNVPRLDTNKAREGWKKVVDGIKNNNGAVIAQLWHCGGFRKLGMQPNPEVPGYTASGLVKPGKKVAHEMTLQDIKETIDAYASDAKICQELGFDGVEIHGAHGYLIDNFLWGGTNIREDSYGGSIQKRSQFVSDIIKAVKENVDNQFIVGLRFSQWKQHDFSAKLASTPDDLKKILMPPVEAGLDFLHSSMRRFWESEFEGSDENLAYWTKKISNIPTIGVGSVGLDSDFIDMTAPATPTSIDKALDDIKKQKYDLIAVGRALLSDYEWVVKMKEGRLNDVIPYTKDALLNLY